MLEQTIGISCSLRFQWVQFFGRLARLVCFVFEGTQDCFVRFVFVGSQCCFYVDLIFGGQRSEVRVVRLGKFKFGLGWRVVFRGQRLEGGFELEGQVRWDQLKIILQVVGIRVVYIFGSRGEYYTQEIVLKVRIGFGLDFVGFLGLSV